MFKLQTLPRKGDKQKNKPPLILKYKFQFISRVNFREKDIGEVTKVDANSGSSQPLASLFLESQNSQYV